MSRTCSFGARSRMPGFSAIGVTRESALATGVLTEHSWPEHRRDRAWAARLALVGHAVRRNSGHPSRATPRPAPRRQVRIAGLGGHGVKLAGTVLSEAAGYYGRLWATQRGDYGSATRGGPSVVDVVLGSDPITYPAADHPDILIAITRQLAAERYGGAIRAGRAHDRRCGRGRQPPTERAIAVPIMAIAREHTGKPLAAGMVALGCVAALDAPACRRMRCAGVSPTMCRDRWCRATSRRAPRVMLRRVQL